MRKFTRTVLAVAVAAAFAVPATAFAADTEVDVTLTGGFLTIAAPATASLGSTSVAPGSTALGTVTPNTVADARGSVLGWTATVSAGSDFVHQTTNTIVISTEVTSPLAWVTANLAPVGTASLLSVAVGAGGSVNQTLPAVVATALLGAGGGSYDYDGDLTFVVPPNAVAGTYKATIVQTVS